MQQVENSTMRTRKLLNILFVVVLALKVVSFIFDRLSNGAYKMVSQIFSGVIILLVLIRIFSIVSRTLKIYQLLGKSYPDKDMPELLQEAMTDTIRGAGVRRMVASEAGVFYYLLCKWRRAEAVNTFSYHRKNGILPLYVILLVVLCVELFATELLLHRVHTRLLEHIFLLLGVYSLLFVLAHIKAMILRPVVTLPDTVRLRCGLLSTISIDRAAIQSVSIYQRAYTKEAGTVKLALLGALEPHNVLLELKESMDVHLLFKRKKGIKKFYFRVDEKEQFLRSIGPMHT